MSTPRKDPPSVRRNASENSKTRENSNPNITTPGSKGRNKPVSKMQLLVSPHKKIRDRKFIVAKKNKPGKVVSSSNCKCKDKDGSGGKCLCVAYENLRVSQDEFTSNHVDGVGNGSELVLESVENRNVCDTEETRVETGFGRVTQLVKAFEMMSTMPKESGQNDDEKEKKTPPRVTDTQGSSSAFCPGEYFLNAESLGFDVNVSSSLDSCKGSVSSGRSVGSRRSRRSGSFSSGNVRKWKKQQREKHKQQQQQRVTSLKPFNLRTEERGKAKEQEFVKKLQEMIVEEEKQRIPIAQGLPWTIDEPECLIKPAVKEVTRPIDLKLHSDVRALERAEFDYQVAEKMTLIEQYKMEKERQQKLEEEEEIRRLRKELVPKAQPMPFFDRPFIPRRSVK